MEVVKVLGYLKEHFQGRDWYYDVGTDEYGRPVVYVNYMSLTIMSDVPNHLGDHQVLVHFAGYKKANREGFVENISKSSIPLYVAPSAPVPTFSVVEEVTETDLLALTDELDRLERICGSNILGDIFFEINDKHNAVTNLSAKYPEIRLSMEKLYNEYGFDVIYEELEL